MKKQNIKTVKTTQGELQYYRDWDKSGGGVVMLNAKTIGRYLQIRNAHPDDDEYGVFWAFDKKQYDKGYKRLVEIGHIKDGDSISCDSGTSLFGTKEGIRGFYNFYAESRAKIAKECDPQEVYFLEYNNHECQFAFDGDKDAIRVILRIWGEYVAATIQRL